MSVWLNSWEKYKAEQISSLKQQGTAHTTLPTVLKLI